MIVIEHNLDVIKTADWLIDMGPEGGHKGGMVVATGTPEEVAEVAESHTGQCLRHVLGLDGCGPGGGQGCPQPGDRPGGEGERHRPQARHPLAAGRRRICGERSRRAWPFRYTGQADGEYALRA